ncbi:hypothetical protein P7C70_g2424, partial [Phenoliferia sp. Uapishka_3]
MREVELTSVINASDYGDTDSEADFESTGSSLLGHTSNPRRHGAPKSLRLRWNDLLQIPWRRHSKADRGALRTVPPLPVLACLLFTFLALFILARAFYPSSPPPHPFQALSNHCAKNAWRPNLYVNCTLSMGLNNLRSELSQCLKFAFDAGAGLVLPLIVLRNQESLNAWSNGNPDDTFVETGFYFDADALRRDMSAWCPALKVVESGELTSLDVREVLDGPRDWWEITFAAGTYRYHVDEVMQKAAVGEPTPKSPIVIREPLRPYSVFDYRSWDSSFTYTFFDMIQWAPRLREIGGEVAAHEKLKEGYIGVHLRLEKDVIPGWAGFDTQTQAYATYINNRPERVIFLACGDASYKSPFAALFPHHTIVDKWDLLATLPPASPSVYSAFLNHSAGVSSVVTTSPLSLAKSLTFDELGCLDYIPMLNASLVLGIGLSSFAYLLGVERRPRAEGHFADTLHMELFPEGSSMVGDERTLLLPPILPEYYDRFP